MFGAVVLSVITFVFVLMLPMVTASALHSVYYPNIFVKQKIPATSLTVMDWAPRFR